jgi:hypothetical protein
VQNQIILSFSVANSQLILASAFLGRFASSNASPTVVSSARFKVIVDSQSLWISTLIVFAFACLIVYNTK